MVREGCEDCAKRLPQNARKQTKRAFIKPTSVPASRICFHSAMRPNHSLVSRTQSQAIVKRTLWRMILARLLPERTPVGDVLWPSPLDLGVISKPRVFHQRGERSRGKEIQFEPLPQPGVFIPLRLFLLDWSG